jgi:hypothetical protein
MKSRKSGIKIEVAGDWRMLFHMEIHKNQAPEE